MRPECSIFRNSLARGGLDDHAKDCTACAQFADRWRSVTAELATDLAVTPPTGFVAAIRRQLPPPRHPIVTFSMRTLPLASGLILVLAVWLFNQGALVSDAYDGSVEESVTWVLEGLENE